MLCLRNTTEFDFVVSWLWLVVLDQSVGYWRPIQPNGLPWAGEVQKQPRPLGLRLGPLPDGESPLVTVKIPPWEGTRILNRMRGGGQARNEGDLSQAGPLLRSTVVAPGISVLPIKLPIKLGRGNHPGIRRMYRVRQKICERAGDVLQVNGDW